MSRVCECGSFAINHQCHGRDGSDGHLCDVCYWRKRAELVQAEVERLQGIINRVISTSKILAEKSPSTPWGDGYKECAIETGNALEDMLLLEGKA